MNHFPIIVLIVGILAILGFSLLNKHTLPEHAEKALVLCEEKAELYGAKVKRFSYEKGYCFVELPNGTVMDI